MKVFNLLKTVSAGILLLGVFLLPTLTATQLVQVLGARSQSQSGALKLTTLGDSKTYVSRDGSKLSIVYLVSGVHQIVHFDNSQDVPQSISFRPSTKSSSIAEQSINVIINGQRQLLFVNSLQPVHPEYSIYLSPHQQMDIGLDVEAPGPLNYGTVVFQFTGI